MLTGRADSDFMYAKFDMHMKPVYLNGLFREFLETPERYQEIENGIDSTLSYTLTPRSLREDFLEKAKQRGYAVVISHLVCAGGRSHWTLMDFTKRYSADPNGGQLGYEMVCYTTSQAAIDFFSPHYDKMREMEKDQGLEGAKAYFDALIEDSSKTYEELVHTLHNA